MSECPRCKQDRSRVYESPEGEISYNCVQCDIFWTEEAEVEPQQAEQP
jgi:transposase-like protein